jgi:CBS domain-containing protein
MPVDFNRPEKEMKAMKSASDIMNNQVVSVHPEDKLETAVKIMTGNKVSGLPVVNADNKVIGILTDRDLLLYSERLKIVPYIDYSAWVLPYTYIPGNFTYENNASLFSKTEVKEVMSRRVVTVKENASWYEVVSLMRKNSVNRIPVTDDKGRLRGIITRTDLLNHLAEGEEEPKT